MGTRFAVASLALALAASFVAACQGVRTEVRGSGTLASESIPVSGFDRIAISGPGLVSVARADMESLQIEAEDNILAVLTAEVSNGRLELGHEPFTNIVPTRPITYRITVRRLLELSVSGSAEATVAIVDPDRLSVVISGSGSVAPAGRTRELLVDISGSGTFDGNDLEARTGDVSVSGSGEAVVRVLDELTASVSGSGHIFYLGNPVLDRSVSGSGSITRH